jgi:hypothetical protein
MHFLGAMDERQAIADVSHNTPDTAYAQERRQRLQQNIFVVQGLLLVYVVFECPSAEFHIDEVITRVT